MADSLINANITAYTSSQVLKVVDESVTRAAEARELRQARQAEADAQQARREAARAHHLADIERQEQRDAQEAVERLREEAARVAEEMAIRQTEFEAQMGNLTQRDA